MTRVATLPSRITTYAVAALVPAAAWWALLGWDTRKTEDAHGNVHGPYDTWQVALLVIVLGAVAVWTGRRGSIIVSPLLAALAVGGCFAISAQFDAENDGLWGVGAVFAAVGTFLGVALVAGISWLVTAERRRRIASHRDVHGAR